MRKEELDEFLFPELYDVFNQEYRSDISWYIEVLKPYSKILELGIGTGRVAIPLAQAGYDVWGIDNSPEMTALLKQKINITNINNIHIIEQDFRDIKLEESFNAAIIPFCTFNFMLSRNDQTSVLNSLKRVLNSGALLILDLLTPFTFPNWTDSSYHWYKTVCDDQQTFHIYVKNEYDDKTHVLKQNRLIKMRSGDYVEEKNLVMKNVYIDVDEIKELLSLCGFTTRNIYGDYNFGVYNSNSTCLLVLAYVD